VLGNIFLLQAHNEEFLKRAQMNEKVAYQEVLDKGAESQDEGFHNSDENESANSDIEEQHNVANENVQQEQFSERHIQNMEVQDTQEIINNIERAINVYVSHIHS
jgi:hypothetical protein